ncbi:hypothetical protein [Bacillus sp. AFS088145]|nr:hypothetical protein [Bacillus sp. AFS088145]
MSKRLMGQFVEEHDLTFKEDFPVNTSGGQLSYGQPGGQVEW